MALNRVVAHLDDTTIAKVAEQAAKEGRTFDEALGFMIDVAHNLILANEETEQTGQ